MKLHNNNNHMGGVAEQAEARKETKYTQLMQSYHFDPLAFGKK